MILPFRGYRYSDRAGELSNLIAPPYDVIDAQYRNELINRSPFNIVHLTLPKSFDSEYHNEVSVKLNAWCSENILVQDKTENYYIVKQSFEIDGRSFERCGFIGLFDLREATRVVRHEITFGRYIDDRIKLLDSTNANLEPIFLIFEDRENLLEKTVKNVDCEEKLAFEDYSIEFSLSKPELLTTLIEKIKKGNLFIADGHHRFQASLEYFKKNSRAPRYIMVYLTNLFSDGLVVLPTHRAAKIAMEQKHLEKISEFFQVEDRKNLAQTLDFIKNCKKISFGIYCSGSYQTWTLIDNKKILEFLPETYSEQWKTLDVAILHHFVLEKIFNVSADKKLFYDRNPQTIVDYV
ncbi:MAG: DUF1015 domain-containing protein, partial [bacterium]|nr:DUF1015 domain-containing protein [bacterium]